MFDVQNTLSFNKDKLVTGHDYDYVTRTSQNQGVLQTTGFVNTENINSAGNWSLGLLQMDFFYRDRPWYAGQFVRKIIPKIRITEKSTLYISTVLNQLKPILLQILVRDFDSVFKMEKIQLPTKNGEIDFDFMENFIAELEKERMQRVDAYLTATGLADYELTEAEKQALVDFENKKFTDFKVVDIFTVKNTGNILSRDIIKDSGDTPYLCASADNNGVSSYISYDVNYLDEGNCVFIGGKTFVVSYQEKDFFSNDSHNLVLYLKEDTKRNRLNHLGLSTCVNVGLGHKYSWGDSISNKKVQKDKIALPTKSGKPDYDYMKTLISAIQKQVIQGVVEYVADRAIN